MWTAENDGPDSSRSGQARSPQQGRNGLYALRNLVFVRVVADPAKHAIAFGDQIRRSNKVSPCRSYQDDSNDRRISGCCAYSSC